MGSRLELQAVFEDILGRRNVYYQPPASVRMNYPAIVYSRKNIENVHANDSTYKQNNCYEVTVIDGNPDSDIVMAVAKLPLCRFDRHFTSDNLNHDVFTLYF